MDAAITTESPCHFKQEVSHLCLDLTICLVLLGYGLAKTQAPFYQVQVQQRKKNIT